MMGVLESEPPADRPEERIIEIEIERLRDFRDHPFRIKEDQEMQDLMDSIRFYGIFTPLIVRPLPAGVYEIVSGHRRKYAAEKLGYRKVPVIIRVMTDDEAVISMFDANLHREHVLPSEKALAIKMKYEAIKRKNGRRKKSSQEEARPKGVRSVHILSQQTGDSAKQIQRYLKLTELIPELLEMLDKRRISFNPAYEIAFLPESQQKKVVEAMHAVQSAPSLSQAQRIRELGQNGSLTVTKAREILAEIKKGEINRVTFKNEQLYQYFPRNYPAKKMKQEILIASSQYPAGVVKSKFLKLNYSHIEYVVSCLRRNTSKVNNIKKYLLAALFNAPSTIDGYYRAEVQHDMPELAFRR